MALGDAKVEQLPPRARGVRVGSLIVYGDADIGSAPHREYLVKGLFYMGEMSAVYGEPGSGKSFWATYIARFIAEWDDSDSRVFGRRAHGAHVLVMALEGATGFEKRLQALRKPDSEPCEHFHYIAQPVNLFSDDQALKDAIAAAKSCGASLIIIDTLNRAMSGGSENDPADMGKFIQNVDRLRQATGAHVMIIHHSGKDAARGMRGHSALLGAVDLALEVKREEDSTRTVTIVKAKDDSDAGRMAFSLEVTELGEDSDGDPVTTCVVREMDAPAQQKPSKNKAGRGAGKDNDELWYREITELFTMDGSTFKATPRKGMPAVPCVTRKTLREWFKIRGLVGATEGIKVGALTGHDRNVASKMIGRLKASGKLAIHGDAFWLPENIKKDPFA